MFRISNDFSSGACGPVLLKFHLEPPLGREMNDCKNGCSPLTKMATMTIYGKTFKKLLLQNRGRTLTFNLFTARSILLPCAFVWEKCSEFQTTSSGAGFAQALAAMLKIYFELFQGSHRFEKCLKMKGSLEKSLKIKFVLKSPRKLSIDLEK